MSIGLVTTSENVKRNSGVGRLEEQAGEMPVPKGIPFYDPSAKPCFLGHYWLKGEPEPLARNVACLDYSVAKEGKLVAYRWQGESVLTKENFTHAISRG